MEDPTTVERAARIVALGVGEARWPAGLQAELVVAAADDRDARVRVAALGALARRARPKALASAWSHAITDGTAAVRRRAAELAPSVASRLAAEAVVPRLLERLADADAHVVETAAWAIGEIAGAGATEDRALAVDALAAATGHRDPLVREAAVAALGAIGDSRGLHAILHACDDKPAIRRRAVLALAPFEGPAVEAALARAVNDRDWQVRQAAEDLMSAG